MPTFLQSSKLILLPFVLLFMVIVSTVTAPTTYAAADELLNITIDGSQQVNGRTTVNSTSVLLKLNFSDSPPVGIIHNGFTITDRNRPSNTYTTTANNNAVYWTFSGTGEQVLDVTVSKSDNTTQQLTQVFYVDNTGPIGGFGILNQVIGRNDIDLRLYLQAEDESNVTHMRCASSKGAVSTAFWYEFNSRQSFDLKSFFGSNYLLNSELMVYCQFKDSFNNLSPIYENGMLVDLQAPIVYAEIEQASDSLVNQPINLYAYDELSSLTKVRLSNDPLMSDGVKEMTYQDVVYWTFDDRRVVWIDVVDAVGNSNKLEEKTFPLYLPPLTKPTPVPGVIVSPTPTQPIIKLSSGQVVNSESIKQKSIAMKVEDKSPESPSVTTPTLVPTTSIVEQPIQAASTNTGTTAYLARAVLHMVLAMIAGGIGFMLVRSKQASNLQPKNLSASNKQNNNSDTTKESNP